MENAHANGSAVADPPDDQIEPTTGLTWGKVREMQKRQIAAERVAGDAAPGPVARAFLPEKLEHMGCALRELVWYDIILLKKLDSPLFRRLKELAKPIADRQPTAFTDEEGFEMIYQFTHDIFEVQKLVMKGRELFRTEATKFVLDLADSKIKDRQDAFTETGAFLGSMVELCVANFVRSMETHVRFAAADSPDSPKLPPPDSRTASAGGSPTSPSSSGTST